MAENESAESGANDSAQTGSNDATNDQSTEDSAQGTADAGEAVEDSESADTGDSNEGDAASDGDSESASSESETGGDRTESAAKPKLEIPEDVLKREAIKYANSTMAAARRALTKIERNQEANKAWERKYGEAASELERLKSELSEFDGDPISFIAKRDGGIKELLDRIATGKRPEKTAAERVAELEAKLAERDSRSEKEARSAAVEAAKGRVFSALGKDDKYDLVANTERGRDELWSAIEEYARTHSTGEGWVFPDSKVYELANGVEAALAADLGKSKKYRSASSANEASSSGNAGAAKAKSGKTIAGNHTPAPAKSSARQVPLDDDEARVAVMRQLGFLS